MKYFRGMSVVNLSDRGHHRFNAESDIYRGAVVDINRMGMADICRGTRVKIGRGAVEGMGQWPIWAKEAMADVSNGDCVGLRG